MVISMERWKGKVAVVTGASAGIGAAIAEQLVEAGLKVAGIARRKEKLQSLENKLAQKSGRFYGIVGDATKEEDILQAFQWVKNCLGPVHVLVNNAGVGRLTSLIDGNAKMWRDVLDTNVLGLCIATREAVKDMRANNVDGHIIHINSIVGQKHLYYSNCNVYPASKFAVTALTETLRKELNGIDSKIKVTSISPGRVATEYFKAMAAGSGQKEMYAHIVEKLKAYPQLESADIADAVIYALSTPPHVQIHELTICPFEKV